MADMHSIGTRCIREDDDRQGSGAVLWPMAIGAVVVGAIALWVLS